MIGSLKLNARQGKELMDDEVKNVVDFPLTVIATQFLVEVGQNFGEEVGNYKHEVKLRRAHEDYILSIIKSVRRLRARFASELFATLGLSSPWPIDFSLVRSTPFATM